MQVSHTPVPQSLVELFHYRWSALVLAELHTSAGARFVTLHHRLGVSRDSLRRTLDFLIDRGLAIRNPGYGHPLRPEYVLLPAGAGIAPPCARLLVVIKSLEVEETALRKWSMPVVAAIATGNRRFSRLKAALPGVTARALTQTLRELEEVELVGRGILATYPPQVHYRLERHGVQVAAMLGDLIAALERRWVVDG